MEQKVWAESNPNLKYPVHFRSKRKVELIYGEAYCYVFPQSQTPGCQNFKVVKMHQELEVLGTQFNIKPIKMNEHLQQPWSRAKVQINTSTVNKYWFQIKQANVTLWDTYIISSK